MFDDFKPKPLHGGTAVEGETVVIDAPPDHELGGKLTFTFWSGGDLSIELVTDVPGACLERAEFSEDGFDLQLSRRYA